MTQIPGLMAIPTNERDYVFLIQSQIIRVLCISAQQDHSENLQSMLLFISYLNVITSLMVIEQHTEYNGKYKVKNPAKNAYNMEQLQSLLCRRHYMQFTDMIVCL